VGLSVCELRQCGPPAFSGAAVLSLPFMPFSINREREPRRAREWVQRGHTLHTELHTYITLCTYTTRPPMRKATSFGVCAVSRALRTVSQFLAPKKLSLRREKAANHVCAPLQNLIWESTLKFRGRKHVERIVNFYFWQWLLNFMTTVEKQKLQSDWLWHKVEVSWEFLRHVFCPFKLTTKNFLSSF
jgi:hypothetical protein